MPLAWGPSPGAITADPVSPLREKFLRCDADILENLSKQRRRHISTGVQRNRRFSSIGMAELLVRSSLPHFDESFMLEKRDDFSRLENRKLPQPLHRHELSADEFDFEGRLAILEKHLDDFSKIPVQFIERRAL